MRIAIETSHQYRNAIDSSTTLAKRAICAAVIASMLTGCSTMVAYSPQKLNEQQTLKFAQGVGTLTIKHDDHELFMYPTYKTQGVSSPTFTLGFANIGDPPVDFSTANVKAYFRGEPVPIYTYSEKVAEIKADKQGKQIALALLGVVAAGAAAHSTSNRTQTTNYSGSVLGKSFAGSSTTRVYDPVNGILAGAAVGGATAVGVRQLENNAQSEELAANTILQENTIESGQMVSGNVILKNCCDTFHNPKPDIIKFEVTVNGKVSVFEFLRAKL